MIKGGLKTSTSDVHPYHKIWASSANINLQKLYSYFFVSLQAFRCKVPAKYVICRENYDGIWRVEQHPFLMEFLA